MPDLTPDEVESRRATLNSLLSASGKLIDAQADSVHPGSPFASEVRSFVRPQSVKNILGPALLLVEAAADEIQSFLRLTEPPTQSKAPLTCVRASLESSALSAWLLDPEIDASDRVKRLLAYLYEGLIQKRKLYREKQHSQIIVSPEVGTIDLEIDRLENQAKQLGFPPVLDPKTQMKRVGIGVRFPHITNLIDSELGQASAYRLLSAAAHSHMWAIAELSFSRSSDSTATPGFRALEKGISTLTWQYLSVAAFKAFVVALRRRFAYLGWDTVPLKSLLQSISDELGVRL
ncbi:hypothetical protein GC176_19500 [bacterium]|nr:hypothetical protein [bacterium]